MVVFTVAGNLACARDHKTLRELGVTHVLTVDVVPLPRSVLRAGVVFKFVQCECPGRT
jgi:hypothetical protein